ncbi:MAG: ABC transporter substrate-binding protein [Candidatus Heimdallarchaeaceae archaeon]
MKSQKIIFTVIICIILLPLIANLGMMEETDEVNIVFYVNFLSPNDSPARCGHWGLLMENTLPKIGIGIEFHESTGWDVINVRINNNPILDFSYIPTYNEGGYDIFFNKFYWDLDPEIEGMFDSSSLTPYGRNFYQYLNPNYDAKLVQYLAEINQTLKTYYFHELQSMLYEDLPAASVLYGRALYGKKDTITGIDWDLLYDSTHRPELWNNTEDQKIVYAIGGELKAPNCFLLEENSKYAWIGNTDAKWMNAVYGRLFQRIQTTHYWEPEIALNYSVSSDLLNYTVSIDPNAKFSDGNPVLAEDIEYTFELHLTPSVISTKYEELSSWFENNQSIEIVDSNKLNFNFSRFCFSPLNVLSEGIIDKSDVEPLIAAYGYSIFTETPLTGNVEDSLVKSCGPFKMDLYEPLNDNTVKMVPNLYWNNLTSSGGKNAILKEYYHKYILGKDNAVTAMEEGTVDIIDCWYYSVQQDYGENAHMNYILAKTGYQADMSFNMKHPIMGTGELTPLESKEGAKLIRKAISHAIPRDIIVEHVFDGIAAPGTSPIADSCVGYNKSMEPYVYDLELAINLMEQAGYEVRITTTETSFTILLSMIIGLTTIIGIRKRRR